MTCGLLLSSLVNKQSALPPVVIIAGPTASGKSAHAMDVARERNGVIINCDSVQIYDAFPILSARPQPEEMQEIPHKLYGALHPDNPCSAGNWREMAEPIIEDALQSLQTPVICGGTGLYIKALTDGLSAIPDIPEEIRRDVNARQKKHGNPGFYALLQERDPVMAARLHPHHTARLIRAYEVIEATGRSLAEWQKDERIGPPPHWRFEIIKLMPPRDALYERCNTRFDTMMSAGALEEAADFLKKIEDGMVRNDTPAARTLGFRPLCRYIKGEISLDEAIERARAETRRYAKRQVTWFKHQLSGQ